MKKTLVFLIFGLISGLFWPVLCNAETQVSVSGRVLEHLTYKHKEGEIEITTNTNLSYWDIENNNRHIIVIGY